MDKFSTKPADKGPKNYIVRALAFSPDSSKLGVAQSDCIVFVYKLGNDWGEKKSICNKFLQTSPVTSMCWPEGHPNDILFGLAEGKIKIGQLKTNKPATLYNTDSYVTALATSPDGNGVVSAHLDGSLYRFFFDDNGELRWVWRASPAPRLWSLSSDLPPSPSASRHGPQSCPPLHSSQRALCPELGEEHRGCRKRRSGHLLRY
jgi:WD40 repeat protein